MMEYLKRELKLDNIILFMNDRIPLPDDYRKEISYYFGFKDKRILQICVEKKYYDNEWELVFPLEISTIIRVNELKKSNNELVYKIAGI